MSRIGKKPITIPKGVTVTIKDRELEFKGAKGVLKTPVPEGITFKQENESLIAERASGDELSLLVDRKENDAEHMWHLAMFVIVLGPALFRIIDTLSTH